MGWCWFQKRRFALLPTPISGTNFALPSLSRGKRAVWADITCWKEVLALHPVWNQNIIIKQATIITRSFSKHIDIKSSAFVIAVEYI